jgi:hypothetical protein
MSVFSVGQRVVVTATYRGAGCNHDMMGYYGHVAALPCDDDIYDDYIYVNLIGRTNGQPIHPHRVGRIDRFPLYEFELEHAD